MGLWLAEFTFLVIFHVQVALGGRYGALYCVVLFALRRFVARRGMFLVRAPGLFSYVPLLSLPKLVFGFVWHRRSYARGGWRLDLGDCRVVPHIAEVAHCCHLVDCWVISSS